MTAQLSMFDQMIFEDTAPATSSPGSGDGLMPYDSQGGPTIYQSGPGVARASHSQLQESKVGPQISDISGPISTNSSACAALQLSLENRLRARLAAYGSPEYALTWKHWDMELGPPICALRASVRHTSDSGSIGSPKKTTTSAGKRVSIAERMNRFSVTPVGESPLAESANAHTEKCNALIATSGLTHSSMTSPKMDVNGVDLRGWATPCANEDAAGGLTGNMQEMMSQQVRGLIAVSSRFTDTDYAALRVLTARWLMGFPEGWENYAATVTPSSRRSQRSSSAPIGSVGDH